MSSPFLKADVLSLYQRLVPAPFLQRLCRQAGLRPNNRIYTLAVVQWLMICQWLEGHGSLEQAVLELLRGLPASFWSRPCKRLQAWRSRSGFLSSNTAAYNQARHRLPLSVVEHCCDHIFEQLTAETAGLLPALGRRAFFFDGTSVQLASSPALRQAYPPGSNQHGASHWPLLRMLVAHDLDTGLAMRPQWGPLNGSQAVSEQQLLEGAIDRLPSAALVVGDANFGVFSVAYAASQRGHAVLLRLTPQRAQRLADGCLGDGIDRRITWRPTRQERRAHPGLPPDACVQGRLLVCRVQPSDQAPPILLALFTTWDAEPQQLLDVYGRRWYIETDLRSLKSTLQLEQLRCTTPAMVAKELDLATVTYNLVRAVTCVAAQKAGLPPRAYGFTRVRNVIQAFAPLIAAASSPEQAQDCFDQMMYYVGQALLPKRNRKRSSYPRAVWPRRGSFPPRKE
jgi:hypothetical protein